MRDRVVFGIRDSSGALVGFTGRVAPAADAVAPKWLNTPTTQIFTKGRVLFGLPENQDRLAAGATPVRVEGVFDALAVTLAGDGRAVGLAPLGTALTVAQADELVRAARDQLIMYGTDDDAAGTKAAHRDFMMLAARGIDVRRLYALQSHRTHPFPLDVRCLKLGRGREWGPAHGGLDRVGGERPVGIGWVGTHSAQGAVHGGAADTEQFGQFGGAVGAEVGQLEEVLGLVRRQLRLLTAQMVFVSRDPHALAGA